MQQVDCDDDYIGESARKFGERYKEYLKASSLHTWLQKTTGHQTTMDNFSIVGKEGHGFTRTIKESMYINDNDHTLNKKKTLVSIAFPIYGMEF